MPEQQRLSGPLHADGVKRDTLSTTRPLFFPPSSFHHHQPHEWMYGVNYSSENPSRFLPADAQLQVEASPTASSRVFLFSALRFRMELRFSFLAGTRAGCDLFDDFCCSHLCFPLCSANGPHPSGKTLLWIFSRLQLNVLAATRFFSPHVCHFNSAEFPAKSD